MGLGLGLEERLELEERWAGPHLAAAVSSSHHL